jgi:two-component system OmpR family sensor kinase
LLAGTCVPARPAWAPFTRGAGRSRPRRSFSLRARIAGVAVLLLAVGGTGSTVLAHELLGMRMWDRVDRGLEEELDDFDRFTAARGGRDGRLPAGTAATAHVRAFLDYNIADGEQALVAVAGGAVEGISSAGFPPALLPAALLQRWARETGGAGVRPASGGRFETARGTAAYRIRRVRDARGTQGALVMVTLPAAQLQEIEELTSVALTVTLATILLGALAAFAIAGRLTAIRDFADETAHELRAPLTVCRCQLMAIRDGLEAPRGPARVAIGEIDRMSRLVDDLEMLGELRHSRLQPREFELAEWMRDVFERTVALAPRAWQLEAVGQGTVRADADMLARAVLNLARNAAQHTGPEAPIAIGAAVAAGGVRIWVRDAGPGVPEDERERIFERFSRGRESAGRYPGAGLGLAIGSAVARAHRGRIELDSRPGAGATFTLVLPIVVGEHVPDTRR